MAVIRLAIAVQSSSAICTAAGTLNAALKTDAGLGWHKLGAPTRPAGACSAPKDSHQAIGALVVAGGLGFAQGGGQAAEATGGGGFELLGGGGAS
jgi:hypothetical protein